MSTTDSSMQGKVCLITGANSGIGKVTALALARMGATVVMVCRDRAKGEAARSEIKAQSGNDTVDLLLADLSSQQSIRQLVADFQSRYTQLYVLINNAGLFALNHRETSDGMELTFAVDYLAPFLLTNLLLDTLKASAPARIVNVSSSAHLDASLNMDDLQSRKRHGLMHPYGQSKLALVMFTYELARRLEGTGVTVNALHPGFVATNIGRSGVHPLLRPVLKLVFSRGISPQEGAKTSIYLATSPEVEGVSGKYFVRSSPRRSSSISYDEALQQQLWDESARLVHLPVQ